MIKNQITLKQLEAFVCVVDMKSFRKAAAVLGTTQPNISNRIATLEESIGCMLMHRDAGSVRLTEKGKALLASAREVLWSAEAFLEAGERQDLIADRLRLGVTELIACTWLHAFLRAVQRAYPAVAVELEVGLSSEIENKQASGELDLALQTGPFRFATSDSIALGTYPFVWVATPEKAAAIGTDATLAHLLASPVLIHAKHTLAARAVARAAAADKLGTEKIIHSSSLASCVQMAVDGMGAALLPAALVRDHCAAGTLQEVPVGWRPAPLEVFARFDRARAPRFVERAAQLAVDAAAAWQEQDH